MAIRSKEVRDGNKVKRDVTTDPTYPYSCPVQPSSVVQPNLTLLLSYPPYPAQPHSSVVLSCPAQHYTHIPP
ncbi:hypothetical protein Pcinc_019661 [Petrolisthes cinctipes]|uniref:Uncharacterized protein n=1 Tax=Petrolisthes cinctipes TaxID=88211 RepID=A0AAE1FLP9_PETCI|nr:hypothetical protein Pcinc_019661 [Petrolisthes cinctipes]